MPQLEESIREFANAAGFSLVGFARAAEADGFHRLQEWLSRGYSGEMAYMQRQAEARRHPASVFPNVRGVIMLAMEYGGDGAPIATAAGAGPSSTPPFPPRLRAERGALNSGKISRYAVGPDYHDLIWRRMGKVVDWLKAEHPGFQARAVADTAPLLERDFARRRAWVGSAKTRC